MSENPPTRVLVLTAAERLPDFSAVYKTLGRLLAITVRILDKTRQRDLRTVLAGEDLAAYDRVLLDLQFKNYHRQARALQGIRGLLIYEEDACQNYLPDSRWHGAFSRLYRRLPLARILVTSAGVCEKLRQEGFSVNFFPKVYDPDTIFFDPGERDIELGFVGRTASAAYSGRRELLESLARQEPLQLLRTAPGGAYRRALNRIRFFASADVGFSEYMAKNFEAMACGCVVLAWRQGGEEAAIGLEDGVHLLLYSDLSGLRAHLASLRNDAKRAEQIADAGRAFVEMNLTYRQLAEQMAQLLVEPWSLSAPPSPPTGWRKLFGSAGIMRGPR